MENHPLKDAIAQYLLNETSLDQFQEWFIPRVWEDQDEAADSLGKEVELRLAEYTNGDWTEEELRQQLKSALYGWSAAQSSRMFTPSSSEQKVTVILGTSSSIQGDQTVTTTTIESAGTQSSTVRA